MIEVHHCRCHECDLEFSLRFDRGKCAIRNWSCPSCGCDALEHMRQVIPAPSQEPMPDWDED